MISKIFYGFFVLWLHIEVVKSILKASTYQEFQRKVVNLLGSFLVESPVSIIETLDEPVSDRMSHSLVAVTFFEVESGPGQGVFHMFDDAK